MGATIQVSDTTSFVYEDGRLIPVEDAKGVEEAKIAERRAFHDYAVDSDEYWASLPPMVESEDWPKFQAITDYVIEKMSYYFALRAEAAKKAAYTTISKEVLYKDLARDLKNSLVLERLIAGKPFLPSPPPLSYTHHWYDLVDNGEGVCIDVNFTTYDTWDGGERKSKNIIRIDGEEWKLIEQVSDEEYIVQWKDSEYVYRLTQMTEDDFVRMLHPQQKRLVTKTSYSWKLTRLEKDENGAGNDNE